MRQNSTEEARDQIMENIINYTKDPKDDERLLKVLRRQVTGSGMCFEKMTPTTN